MHGNGVHQICDADGCERDVGEKFHPSCDSATDYGPRGRCKAELVEEQGVLVRRSREQLEQEIGKFTIIEKDGLIIGCAALYPYPEERKAEMACVAIHPDYRDGNRGLLLLNYMKHRSKSETIDQIFVLTTHSLHWFRD